MKDDENEISDGGSGQLIASPKVWTTSSRRDRTWFSVRRLFMYSGSVGTMGLFLSSGLADSSSFVGASSSACSVLRPSSGEGSGTNFVMSSRRTSVRVSDSPIVSPRRTSTS